MKKEFNRNEWAEAFYSLGVGAGIIVIILLQILLFPLVYFVPPTFETISMTSVKSIYK